MATVPVADASSPAVVKQNNNALTVATAPFTAPADTCIVIGFTSDADTSTGAAPTCDDNGASTGVTFNLDPNSRGYGGLGHDVGLVALFSCTRLSSATTFTNGIRITHNRGAVIKPRMLVCRVYPPDQVDVDDPIGAVAAGSFGAGTTAVTSGAMTPETDNGGLRMMWLDWNATGTPTVFQSNTELVDAFHNASLSTNVQLGKQTYTVAGVAESIGATKPASGADGNWLAYELRGPQIVTPPVPALQENGSSILLEDGTLLMF